MVAVLVLSRGAVSLFSAALSWRPSSSSLRAGTMSNYSSPVSPVPARHSHSCSGTEWIEVGNLSSVQTAAHVVTL